MTELYYMAFLLIWDWKTACEHMSYQTTHIVWEDGTKTIPNISIPPSRLPFYDRKLPWPLGDVFHAVSGIRYLLMLPVVWHGFGGTEIVWDGNLNDSFRVALWMGATAAIDMAGWAVLKVLHGKHTTWGLVPRWLGGWRAMLSGIRTLIRRWRKG